MAFMRSAGTAFFLAWVLLAGCHQTTRPLAKSPIPEIPPEPPYVAGRVIVGFHDGVSEQQADTLFVSHGLRWESNFSKQFFYWVEVESGNLDAHIARLSRSPIVSWAKRRGNPNGVPNAVYIIVHFKATATHASAQALIDSMPGLRVSSMVLPPQWGVALVGRGRERAWIAILERERIVKYATVDGIASFY